MYLQVNGASTYCYTGGKPFDAAKPTVVFLHGVRSKTALYRWAYVIAKPLFGLVRHWAPDRVTTSEQVGRAMLVAAKRGAPRPLVEMADINALR